MAINSFEVSEVVDSSSRNRSFINNRKLMLIVLVVITGVIFVAMIWLVAGLESITASLEITTLSPPPVHPGQLERIDCYPEMTLGIFRKREEVIRDECLRVGCTYDSGQLMNPEKPRCYISIESSLGAGYRVSKKYALENGFLVELKRNQLIGTRRGSSADAPQPENVLIDSIVLVEYISDQVLRVKVC